MGFKGRQIISLFGVPNY